MIHSPSRRFILAVIALLAILADSAGIPHVLADRGARPTTDQNAGLTVTPSDGTVSLILHLAPTSVPPVDVAAFRGQGRLAFVWSGQLYLLNGDAGILRRLAAVGLIGNLAWSPDGHWLAYIHVTNGDLGSGQLWVVRADGSDAHQVMGLPAPVQTFSWSPVANMLAIGLQYSPHGPSGLWLATPLGRPRELAANGAGAQWSPDGGMLAYSATLQFTNPLGRSDALYTVPAAGGAPARRFVAKEDGIELLGWWPNGKGVLFWRDPLHSASIAADGLMLYTLPLGGAPTPHPLTTTLTYPDWIARSPSGRRLLLVSGGGREAWHDKSLSTCDVVTAACQAVSTQHGTVALDLAWSPRDNRIAFVQARDLGNAGGFGGTQPLQAWVQTHTLWVASATGAGAHELTAAGAGVYQPQWSHDGRHLLYIRDDAVWLVDANGGAPVKIVGPFPSAPPLFGYYGHVDWTTYIPLAWHQP